MSTEMKKETTNLPAATPVVLANLITYVPHSIVSRTFLKNTGGTLTLFAFDVDQELSEHTAPFDAYVQVLDGTVELKIGGNKITANAGETILMPANIPHALKAIQNFKMLLTMIRG